MKSFLFYFIVLLTLFYIYFYHYNTGKCKINDLLDENIVNYNIHSNTNNNNETKKCTDMFNIKEYESINDNIIIHNKFKTELLEYNNQKCILQNQIKNIKNEEKEKKKKEILINIEKENENNLIKNIKLLKTDLNTLKLLFKEDIKNLLFDVKQNKLSLTEKELIKNAIKIEINESYNTINKYINMNKINNNINDKYLNDYITLLSYKIKMLDKKYLIYKKILN
jgi:hypothetical protein